MRTNLLTIIALAAGIATGTYLKASNPGMEGTEILWSYWWVFLVELVVFGIATFFVAKREIEKRAEEQA